MLGRFVEGLGCFVTFIAAFGIWWTTHVFGERCLWGLTSNVGIGMVILLVLGFVVMAFGGWVQRPTIKVRVRQKDDEDNGFRRSWTLVGKRSRSWGGDARRLER